MQIALAQAVPNKGSKVNLVRYADDFIVTGATKELLEQKVKPALTAFLTPRGLELSEQKTVITHISNGFNFLGHTVRQFGDKVLTRPAKSNTKTFRDKIRRCIQSALGFSQEMLLRQLNPLIRGWANYYRQAAAKRTFNRLDHYIFWQLWRWVKRRHPEKSAQWKQRKYFSAAGENWLFSVRLSKEKGQSQVLSLYRAASTTIRRHTKIRGAANPYDPDYTRYFEARRPKDRRWRPTAGYLTPTSPRPTRIVAHWLQFAAACPHPGAPVGAA